MAGFLERKIKERTDADPEMERIRELSNQWTREQQRRVGSALVHAAAFPGIRIDRAQFLSEALKKQCPTRNAWAAVGSTPAQAGFTVAEIEAAANRVIREETVSLTATSAVTSIPKGWFILMTLPVDIAQYYAHMLRLVQKLYYLYGGAELQFQNGRPTEDTAERLMEMIGVMYGETGAQETIGTITSAVSSRFESKTNGRIRSKIRSLPPVQSATTYINQKIPVTKAITSAKKSVIPYGKMLATGVVSFAAFRDMAKRLKIYLTTQPEAKYRPQLAEPQIDS